MHYLKQSTASQPILLGPFVNDTDGNTAETGLMVNASDIRLSANGGNMAAKNSGGGTHDEAGWYQITLDATDTATVGRLQISAHVTGALPVFADCTVLEEAIYDALFAASANIFEGAAGSSTLRALTDPAGFKKNTAGDIAFPMYDSTDGVTPLTGETVVAQRSIDGAAFANCTNTPMTEIGATGRYEITLSAADLNGDLILLKFTSAGTNPRDIAIKTET